MDQRLAFFDSNVLIAASVAEHEHHLASYGRLALFRNGGGVFAAHSLAETYNTLTKRSGYRMPPSDATRIVQFASITYTIVTLDSKETMAAIEDAAMRNLRGAILYDALLLACARKIDAKTIYTSNVKHFRLIAPDLADRIVEP
jgi:predicted nucleic acid-binding protein